MLSSKKLVELTNSDAHTNAPPVHDTALAALKEAFTTHLVLPDVVPLLPNIKLSLAYDNAPIELGNLIAPENTELRPIVDFSHFDKSAYYTLIMTDPDMPNRALPSEREYLHWMAVNITKNSFATGDIIAVYEAPLPKRGSGLHRYVFLLLEQSSHIVFDMKDLRKDSSDENEKKLKMPKTKDEHTQVTDSYDTKIGIQFDNRKSEIGLTSVSPTKPRQAQSLKKTPLQKGNGSDSGDSVDLPIGSNRSVMCFEDQKYNPQSQSPKLMMKGIELNIVEPKMIEDKIKEPLSSALKATKPIENKDAEDIQRFRFSTKSFMAKYMIRNIAAGNFFQTEYDNYVGEKLHAHISPKKKSARNAGITPMPFEDSPMNEINMREKSPIITSESPHDAPLKNLEKRIERTVLIKK